MPARPPRPTGATAGALPVVPDCGFEVGGGRRRNAGSCVADGSSGALVAHAVRRARRGGRFRCLGGVARPGLGLCGERAASVPSARGRCRSSGASRGHGDRGPIPGHAIFRASRSRTSAEPRSTPSRPSASRPVADRDAPQAIGAKPDADEYSATAGARPTVDGYLPRVGGPTAGLTIMRGAPFGSVVLAWPPGDGRGSCDRYGGSAPTRSFVSTGTYWSSTVLMRQASARRTISATTASTS